MRTFESVEAPSSFANAIMTTIMDNFDALKMAGDNSYQIDIGV